MASSVMVLQKRRTIFAFSYPGTKEIIRGEYENKIRRDSPPEKIFEVFASELEGDSIFMNHEDFFNSICPFAFSTKEEKADKEDEKADKEDEKTDKEEEKP